MIGISERRQNSEKMIKLLMIVNGMPNYLSTYLVPLFRNADIAGSVGFTIAELEDVFKDIPG